MKILIQGVPKSGTTALYYHLKASMPKRTVCLFEPVAFQPADERAGRDLLAKILIYNHSKMRYETFRSFEKKILLVRDPRDVLISRLLYQSAYHELYGTDEIAKSFYHLLRDKEKSPRQGSFLQLALYVRQYSEFSLRSCFQPFEMMLRWDTAGAFVYHYEDLCEGRFSALEDYLGFKLNGQCKVPSLHARVGRTRSFGSWRDWFTQEDVDYFREPLGSFMKRFGYDPDDWDLRSEAVIPSEHASLYFLKLVNEVRREKKMKPLKIKESGPLFFGGAQKVSKAEKLNVDARLSLSPRVKPALFLHIGTQEAGTCAIQAFLRTNQGKLERQGIGYLGEALEHAHPIFRKMFFLKDRIRHETLASYFRDAPFWEWQEIFWGGALRGLGRMILSYPGLFYGGEAAAQKFRLATRSFPVRVVVYLRRQDLWFQNIYANSQIFSKTFPGFPQKFQDWVMAQKERGYYDRWLAPWQKAFGKENVSIRVFEKKQLRAGNAAIDFAEWIGIKQPEEYDFSKAVEKAYSRDIFGLALENLRAYSRRADPSFPPIEFLDRSLGGLEKIPAEDFEPFLSSAEARELLHLYEASNQKIAREGLGRDDGKLFYEGPETANIPQGQDPFEQTQATARILFQICFSQERKIKQLHAMVRDLQMKAPGRSKESTGPNVKKASEKKTTQDRPRYLEILEAKTHPLTEKEAYFSGFQIEQLECSQNYGVFFRGWAVGKISRPARFRLLYRHTVIGEMPFLPGYRPLSGSPSGARHGLFGGFSGAISLHLLPSRFRVRMNVFFENGQDVDIGWLEIKSMFYYNNFYFKNDQHPMIYAGIPKNACTLLKYNFTVLSGDLAYDPAKESVHYYLNANPLAPAHLQDPSLLQDRRYYKFAILRNPYRRLISTYFDKFVRFLPAIEAFFMPAVKTICRAQGREGAETLSISFEEFVRYIAEREIDIDDQHWRPQHLFLGDVKFDHYGQFERLDVTLDHLEKRCKISFLRDLGHAFPVERKIPYQYCPGLKEPWKMLGAELKQAGVFPLPAQMLSKELTAILTDLYAEDIALYERKFGVDCLQTIMTETEKAFATEKSQMP
ncbi:MAG: sulfotransferase family protein [Candidatus Omnitrophota bacterium]